MLEIIVNGRFPGGIKINGHWINKEHRGDNTHLIIYDEFPRRLYDLVIDNKGECKILKTNKEKKDVVKKDQFIWLKVTEKGIKLFESVLEYDSFCFSFFDDHMDPFSKPPKQITLEQIRDGLLIEYNVAYHVAINDP